MPHKCKIKKKEYQKEWSVRNKERRAVYNKAWRDRNKEKLAESAREWRERNKEKYKESQQKYQQQPDIKEMRQMGRIKRKYNLSKQAYLKMFEDQDYKCAICTVEVQPFTLTAHVDHDHSIHPVVARGILCHNCNRGLGGFKDDEASVLKAFLYLRRTKK